MPFLFRATPQHGNRQTASSLGSQTSRRQGIIETLRRHPRRYVNTAARDTYSTIRALCVRAGVEYEARAVGPFVRDRVRDRAADATGSHACATSDRRPE